MLLCEQQERSHIDSSPGGTLGAGETTKINRNQHNSTESPKVITNHQKSSLVPDRSHQKSSIFSIRGLVSKHLAVFTQIKQRVLEHKGVCHRWAGNELQIPLANGFILW